MYIRNLKYWAFNTNFSTTQYPYSILYLPTQIQMDVVYRKAVFKQEFLKFLMYKELNNYILRFIFIPFFNKGWSCNINIRENIHIYVDYIEVKFHNGNESIKKNICLKNFIDAFIKSNYYVLFFQPEILKKKFKKIQHLKLFFPFFTLHKCPFLNFILVESDALQKTWEFDFRKSFYDFFFQKYFLFFL